MAAQAAAADDRDRVRLERCLAALERMVDEGHLATSELTTGVELEVALVDRRMRPATVNHAVLERSGSDVLTSELGSWNVEANLPPRSLPEAADRALEQDIAETVARADAAARDMGARAVTIGILPTLEAEHLEFGRLTDDARYVQLDEQVRRARGDPFGIDIAAPAGDERVQVTLASVAAEAACTSLQLHLQLAPDALAAYWNAAQAIAGVQVATAANSPFLMGRRLWAETRVPLFTQAVDTRTAAERERGDRPRVWFGDTWVSSALELFSENVRRFDTLLPLSSPSDDGDGDDGDGDPLAVLDHGGTPALAELCTHNSTVWRWNRPVYDVADGTPHVRLENRVLPAGPTAVDAVADALFFYGLARTLAEQDVPVWRAMPFAAAEDNFVAGARRGIEATLTWPGRGPVAVTELVRDELLPAAADGLSAWGVDAASAHRYLSVIEGRCRTRRTGATWQGEVVADLERTGVDRREALATMVELYLAGTESDEPVHTWSVRG